MPTKSTVKTDESLGKRNAYAILNSRAVPVKGERCWNMRPEAQVEQRGKARRAAWSKVTRGRADAPKYAAYMRARRKYDHSAGIYPYRNWKPWEVEFVHDNPGRTERELAVALGRSIRSVHARRRQVIVDYAAARRCVYGAGKVYGWQNKGKKKRRLAVYDAL